MGESETKDESVEEGELKQKLKVLVTWRMARAGNATLALESPRMLTGGWGKGKEKGKEITEMGRIEALGANQADREGVNSSGGARNKRAVRGT